MNLGYVLKHSAAKNNFLVDYQTGNVNELLFPPELQSGGRVVVLNKT